MCIHKGRNIVFRIALILAISVEEMHSCKWSPTTLTYCDVAYTGGWVGTQVLRDVYQRADWGTMEDVVIGGRELLGTEHVPEPDTETETPLHQRDAL